ncbi:MAG: SWIM zinc finger family protein, partial [Nannocystaceae bacterium]
GGASQVVTGEDGSCLALFSDLARKPVEASGRIRDPIGFREMFSTLYDVVRSDFRYVPRDRTAYLAYMRMRKQTAGMDVWQAQQAYFDWMSRNDPNAWLILDPIVTVHPDALMFEVFSKDEGTYAKLDIDWSAVELDGDLACGTTSIDYSKALFDGVQRLRSYRESRLSIGREAVEIETEGEGKVVEKNIQVPDTWLRGFLQVQSASTLPRTVFQIAAIDLYNVLRQLRMQRDQKKGGRGIRIELSPGEPVRLVLEPWETVIETGAGTYTGRVPGVVRIWGRRRLMLLQRMLPLAETIDIHILGSGLPSFYVLRAGAFTMTLGLSGFTASNWSQAVSFDLLLPRGASERAKALLADIVTHLQTTWRASAAQLATTLGQPAKDVLQALQLGCQHGQLMYDLARDVYRLRPLVGADLNLERLQFRNKRERVAHDLLAGDNVKIVSENRIHGVGLELTGKVDVAADKREYRPVL